MSKLLVIGGAHVDRLARLKTLHRPQTSNPVVVQEDIGGGGFNAARAARRFGVDISLLSARGGDASGGLVEEAIKSAGLHDLSSVHLDRATPSYTAILEPSGELVTAIADMDLYETAISRSFKRAPVQKAARLSNAVLCDANLSGVALQSLFADVASEKPVFALAISAEKVTRFSPVLPKLFSLFLNRFEAAALTGLSETVSVKTLGQALAKLGLSKAVVSAGGNPAALMDGDTITLITPPETEIVDVTGAGDCLAGTMIAAILGGKDFISAAKLGLAAASITASREGASPVIATQEIEALAASHHWIIE